MDNIILKKVEKIIDGVWTQCEFSELKDGDKFRMYESNGELEADVNGRTEFVVSGEIFTDPIGVLGVNIKE